MPVQAASLASRLLMTQSTHQHAAVVLYIHNMPPRLLLSKEKHAAVQYSI